MGLNLSEKRQTHAMAALALAITTNPSSATNPVRKLAKEEYARNASATADLVSARAAFVSMMVIPTSTTDFANVLPKKELACNAIATFPPTFVLITLAFMMDLARLRGRLHRESLPGMDQSTGIYLDTWYEWN